MSRHTVWANLELKPGARELFFDSLARLGCRLLQAQNSSQSVLAPGATDPALAEADIAYGQPDPADVLRYPNLRWVALSTAGYTRYDTAEFRAAMQARGTVVTNSSQVFADPCAQHVLAQMLALERNLPVQLRNQDGPRDWRYYEDRASAGVLTRRHVLLLGFGAIGRRLAELLRPFGCRISVWRRTPKGDEGLPLVDDAGLATALGLADHVVSMLPEAPGTLRWMDAAKFAQMKSGARFYNIGRGTTVDQAALIGVLQSGHLGAAYLDVMDPEPLPPAHPLWRTKNCHLTCHIGGGTHEQDPMLVAHFLANLQAFIRNEPLADRVM
jgi:phosphoglycerate dehydrogenase-like enzyme